MLLPFERAKCKLQGFGLAAAALSQHMLLFGADCWMEAVAVTVTDSCHSVARCGKMWQVLGDSDLDSPAASWWLHHCYPLL